MRVFLGVGLTPDCRREIREALAPMRTREIPVSWTPEDNLHVTLKFLGETSPAEAARIAGALSLADLGVAPFGFVAEGVGGFPSGDFPRVLWAGIRDPLELVGKLQQNMETVLSGAGIPREGRPFHPHVTVGRVRGSLPPGWGKAFRESLAGRMFGVIPVGSYRMYESRRSPSGVVYAVLEEFQLRAGCERQREETR